MARKDVTTTDVLIAADLVADQPGVGPLWHLLMLTTEEPKKVVLAAIERDIEKGLLECGVSVGTAWLTDEGRKSLEEFQTVEVAVPVGRPLSEEDIARIRAELGDALAKELFGLDDE